MISGSLLGSPGGLLGVSRGLPGAPGVVCYPDSPSLNAKTFGGSLFWFLCYSTRLTERQNVREQFFVLLVGLLEGLHGLKNTPRTPPEHPGNTRGTPPEHPQNNPRTPPEHPQNTPGTPLEHFQIMDKMSPGVSWGSPRVSWGLLCVCAILSRPHYPQGFFFKKVSYSPSLNTKTFGSSFFVFFGTPWGSPRVYYGGFRWFWAFFESVLR